jgi:hypothetical protein
MQQAGYHAANEVFCVETTEHMINTPCTNIKPTKTPIQVFLADSSHIKSTHEGELDLPMLPPAARTAHLLPKLKPKALLSIGQLCDNGCTAEFSATDVIIKSNNTPILQGYRDPMGLWRIPIQHSHTFTSSRSIPQHSINSIIDERTQHELIQLLHATCFSPTKSTWIKAIKNNYFTTWPLVNDTIIQKYFRNSTATAKGHLDQQRKNIQSTKQLAAEDDNDFTIIETTNHRTNFVYATIGVIQVPTGQVYMDQTGHFPVDSNEGHKYVMILYDYDSNAILTASLKDRKGPTIKQAYEQLH